MNKNSVLYDPIFCKPSEPNYGEKLTKKLSISNLWDRYNFVLEQMRTTVYIPEEYERICFKDKIRHEGSSIKVVENSL